MDIPKTCASRNFSILIRKTDAGKDLYFRENPEKCLISQSKTPQLELRLHSMKVIKHFKSTKGIEKKENSIGLEGKESCSITSFSSLILITSKKKNLQFNPFP